MKVGKQEQICVKLDKQVVALLATEVSVSGTNKNRVINKSITMYSNLADLWRRYMCGTADSNDVLNYLYEVWK